MIIKLIVLIIGLHTIPINTSKYEYEVPTLYKTTIYENPIKFGNKRILFENSNIHKSNTSSTSQDVISQKQFAKARYKRNRQSLTDETSSKISNNNYEEQKPVIIMASEAGKIEIDDFNGGKSSKMNNFYYDQDDFKSVATTQTISTDDNESEYNEDYENFDNNKLNQQPNDKQSDFLGQIKNFWNIFNAIDAAFTGSLENKKPNSREEEFSNEQEQSLQSNEFNRNNIIKTDLDGSKEIIKDKRDIGTAEGRYIKGDPLKGYYDFVITEGSYKFWAAFQIATALLIIYSTFAAIYYSKVNPLVGDYDYVDYLGGGRSLSDDSDFVDDLEPYNQMKPSKNSTEDRTILIKNSVNWIPQLGHSLKFIIESIDKLPDIN